MTAAMMLGHSLVRLAVGLVVVAADAALDVAPAAAEFPGRSGRIFFTTPNRPDFPPVCGTASVSPNGTAYECVDPFGFDPSASPGGRLIVEERPGMPVPIYTVKPDGTGARRVTHERAADSEAPTFSPDGRRILYFQSGGDADGAYVMNVDGSGQTRLTPDTGFGPVFSPSGAQFAYFGRGIAIANADGSGSNLVAADVNTSSVDPTTLTLNRTNIKNTEPNWSPDGRRIAFTRESATSSQTCDLTTEQCKTNQDHQIDVYVMNADGSGLRQLTSTRAVNEDEPSWSPDGRQIAYFRMPEQNADGVGEIWAMNADGTGQHAVARGWHPHWSTVQGGPSRPRLVLEQVKRNKRSKCLGIFDFFRASVTTTASKRTLFDLSISIDGREVEQEFDTRDLGAGMDTVRPGRHRLQVVMSSHAINDTVIRRLMFRRCRGGHL